MKTTQERITDEVNYLGRTLLLKNNDYGDSVFMHPILAADVSPENAIAVRMSDKFQRLAQLLTKNASPHCEPLDDTLLDIAGYCILWLVMRERHREVMKDKTAKVNEERSNERTRGQDPHQSERTGPQLEKTPAKENATATF